MAPTAETSNSIWGLGFDAEAETAYFCTQVPYDWDGASDMLLMLVWTPTSGDILQNTEDVYWQVTYRSLTINSDPTDHGTAVTVHYHYTQSGVGTDEILLAGNMTIDYDHVNQPLHRGDALAWIVNRQISSENNSYSGKAILVRMQLQYTSYDLAGL